MFLPVDIKRAKWWMTIAEIPAGIAWSGIGITYLTGFFLTLKANSFQIGLVSALPALCSLAAILGGWMVGRCRGRKHWYVALTVLFYLAHIVLGAIPFLFHAFTSATQIQLALLVLTGAYALLRIMEVFWYPWASAIIPEGQRASFFGRLMIVGTLIMMPGSYLIGRYLDFANDLAGFAYVFAACGLIGTSIGVVYGRVPDVKIEPALEGPSLMTRLAEPVRDPHFRAFLLFAFTSTLAGSLCGPFTNVFMIETLRIPYTWIAIYGILYSFFTIVFMAIWGYLVDKYGSRPVLLLCAAPTVGLFFLWVFNEPGRHFLVPLVYALSGIASAGSIVAVQNQLMGISTGRYSAAYFTVYQIVTGLVGFVAPLIGSALVDAWRGVQFECLGYPIGRYQLLFALAGVLSLLPLLFIVRLHEPRGKSALYLLRSILMVNPFKLTLHLFAYHRSLDEKGRLSATIGLGHTGSPVAMSELINTLDDPLYFVRREAALALGRIGDRDAVMPLIAKLSDEYANIQYEAAWALGNIKDNQSIEPLLECLNSADPKMRGYAAMALGEIGASAAIEPLVERLEHSQDVFETTCAANALSRLGYKKALWKTLEKLVRSDQPVVRRQLSVSLGDLIGEQGSFYRLLTREERVYGDEVGRILTRMNRMIQAHCQARLGSPACGALREGLKRIEELYTGKRYADALRAVVAVSEQFLGPESSGHNATQATGRRFVGELLTQNEALGSRVYWEECLVSIYALDLILRAAEA